MDLQAKLKEVEAYVIEMRRYFHENPELSWEEYNTSKKIQEELDKMDIPYQTGCKTGVIASIKGAKEGKVLGIRADIDALPVEEKTDLDFKSKVEGKMHACGHDSHTAILLGAAKILNDYKDQLQGDIKLIFQPAEEDIQTPGAACMLETGALDDLDRIIALHLMTTHLGGQARLKTGPIMASSDTFDIYIEGVGGHGAMPALSVDPIVAGSMVVGALQTFVSRENDPNDTSVLTIGAFNSGHAPNVIPQNAHLRGTFRTVSNEVRDGIEEKMKRILDGVATTTRTTIDLDYHYGSPATINDKEVTDLGEKILSDMLGENFSNEFPILMGSEDFSYYMEKIPGSMMFLGAGIEDMQYPHHNEKFCIDESVMITGVEYFVRYGLEYLS